MYGIDKIYNFTERVYRTKSRSLETVSESNGASVCQEESGITESAG